MNRGRGQITKRAQRGALLAGLVLVAGCASTKPFVYKPGTPAAGAARLPVKVAVLPFQDGTENFTRRGSVLVAETLVFNLAKGGVGGTIDAVTPTLWAKAFAEDLAASGRFGAARFVFDASELRDEDYAVDGTVRKAYMSGGWQTPSQFELELRAVRRKDGLPVWERTVTRSPTTDRNLYDGCGLSVECMNDRLTADLNRVMRELYAEATADLAAAVGGRPAGAANGGPGAPTPAGVAPKPPEPVEDTIKRIMEGK